MNSLDPRRPLVVDTRPLGRRPGSMVQLTRDVVLEDEIGTDVMALPTGTPAHLECRLESVTEGVLVSGSVRAEATGACVRCLDDVVEDVVAHFQDLFVYADRAAHLHDVGADDDQRVLEGDLIDLEPVLRDAVVPTLPFQPVCRVDCPGLCSECGARLADDPGHRHDRVDPRWASLESLRTPARDPAE